MLFSGRERERNILEICFRSADSEMVAVIGRRRVGKTRLVREVFGTVLDFEMTGIYEATLVEQLNNFKSKFEEHTNKTLEKHPGPGLRLSTCSKAT